MNTEANATAPAGASAAANPYCAVRPALVLAAAELFGVRSSNLDAGEKKLLVTAQAIDRGRVNDRWGHHAEAVIRKFCAHTAMDGQAPLPWQELLEDAAVYDGVEGVSSRTGNRPLSAVPRQTISPERLRTALAALDLDLAEVGRQARLPEPFLTALLDGSWPSVSPTTLERLQDLLGTELVAPEQDPQQAARRGGRAATLRLRRWLPGLLAAGALVVIAVALALGPGPTPASVAGWEVLGYWDYDGIDGAHIPGGLVVREQAGAALRKSWSRHLELADHAELRPRQRNLWPVEVSRQERRVCINYPNYPSYTAFVDFPGSTDDGYYAFGPCADRPGATPPA